jgi:uncharacterized membrane protein YvbJ
MAPCPSCGHENPDDASFCNACATPLSSTEIARERIAELADGHSESTNSSQASASRYRVGLFTGV